MYPDRDRERLLTRLGDLQRHNFYPNTTHYTLLATPAAAVLIAPFVDES